MKIEVILDLWEYKAESKAEMPKKYIKYAKEFIKYHLKSYARAEKIKLLEELRSYAPDRIYSKIEDRLSELKAKEGNE